MLFANKNLTPLHHSKTRFKPFRVMLYKVFRIASRASVSLNHHEHCGLSAHYFVGPKCSSSAVFMDSQKVLPVVLEAAAYQRALAGDRCRSQIFKCQQ